MKVQPRVASIQGFTLIELSIVLVIIGLIVGGVLVGQNLIAAAGVLRIVKGRCAQAELPESICNHTFRGTGITVFLQNGGALEAAQDMANHTDPRTTKLYDRRKDLATLGEIERCIAFDRGRPAPRRTVLREDFDGG